MNFEYSEQYAFCRFVLSEFGDLRLESWDDAGQCWYLIASHEGPITIAQARGLLFDWLHLMFKYEGMD